MALIDKLRAIGDAIREKNGTSDLIPLSDMPQAIRDISSGVSEEKDKGTVLSDFLVSEAESLQDTGGESYV